MATPSRKPGVAVDGAAIDGVTVDSVIADGIAPDRAARDAAVEESLFDLLKHEPFRVSFFQAVRLMRRLFPGRKPVGYFERPEDEAVRFLSNPSLDFPASEIQSMHWPEKAADLPVKMLVNFMGLSSPVGVLPTRYTELIIERAQKPGKKKDTVFRDFLDIFNHRIISLMYRAWEKHRFFVGYEQQDNDQLTPLLLSVIGLNTKGMAGRQDVADHTLVFYAGLLGQHPRSAQGLRQILEDYFRVPAEVQQFVGRWIRLPERDHTRLNETGSFNEQLGRGAVVGDEIWDQQSTMRVKLGPLTQNQYLDFLPRPRSEAYAALKSLLKFYSNDEINFEVQLVLKRDETPPLELSEGGNLMLGWLTWIKNAPLGRDPGDTILQM